MSLTSHRRSTVAAAGVALTFALAACSANNSASDNGALINGDSSKNSGGRSQEGAGTVSTPGSTRANVMRIVLDSRKLIRTATLTVAVKDVAAAVTATQQAVERADGAVYSEQVDHDKKGASSARLTLKVPPSSYSAVLSSLATSLGTELSRSQDVKDVTEEVVDVAARLDVQRRAISRIKVLLDNATKLSDVISLENDLSTREAAMESLQARQRTLAAQTDLATIELTLQRSDTTIVAESLGDKEDERGFIAGLKGGWSAFQTSAEGLLTAVGAVLPFAVLASLGALAAVGWRRRRRLGLAAADVVD